MEPAILTAMAGLAGSIVGAASSLTTTWLSQRNQHRAQWRLQEGASRETLYAEFITEASKCLIDAVSHEADRPEVLLGLIAILGRMRLKSSRPVIEAAERLMQFISKSYAAPNLTFAELRAKFASHQMSDPLGEFGDACRFELEQLRAP